MPFQKTCSYNFFFFAVIFTVAKIFHCNASFLTVMPIKKSVLFIPFCFFFFVVIFPVKISHINAFSKTCCSYNFTFLCCSSYNIVFCGIFSATKFLTLMPYQKPVVYIIPFLCDNFSSSKNSHIIACLKSLLFLL